MSGSPPDSHLGLQGEFPVGVVESKGFSRFQHLSQRGIDSQTLNMIGYLLAGPDRYHVSEGRGYSVRLEVSWKGTGRVQ